MISLSCWTSSKCRRGLCWGFELIKRRGTGGGTSFLIRASCSVTCAAPGITSNAGANVAPELQAFGLCFMMSSDIATCRFHLRAFPFPHRQTRNLGHTWASANNIFCRNCAAYPRMKKSEAGVHLQDPVRRNEFVVRVVEMPRATKAIMNDILKKGGDYGN